MKKRCSSPRCRRLMMDVEASMPGYGWCLKHWEMIRTAERIGTMPDFDDICHPGEKIDNPN